jgi:hypothetical protein
MRIDFLSRSQLHTTYGTLSEVAYVSSRTCLHYGQRCGSILKLLNPDVLDPDYTEPPGQTYTRFARYMVECGDGIKLLYSTSQGRDTCDLPSWVPNWAARDMLWAELAPKDDGGPNYHFSSATSAPEVMKLSTVSDYLVGRGIVVDSLKQIGVVPNRACSKPYGSLRDMEPRP